MAAASLGNVARLIVLKNRCRAEGQPRAAGATYNFGRWVPTRSFYYPYVPGSQANLPYGFSPEPYYFPEGLYTTGMN